MNSQNKDRLKAAISYQPNDSAQVDQTSEDQDDQSKLSFNNYLQLATSIADQRYETFKS